MITTNSIQTCCFTEELLEECKKFSPKVEQDLQGYGSLIEPELCLIDIRQIHGTEPIRNTKTGETKPKGFQTRADIDVDGQNVRDIAYDIANNDWEVRRDQPIIFELPSEWQYYKNGVLVKYGIVNGTHRYYAALECKETHFICWVADVPLSKLRKLATARLNKIKNASKPRTDNDIIQSILAEMNDATTDLYKKISSADDVGNKDMIKNILINEIEDYNVHHATRDSIYRAITHVQTLFTPERKQWSSNFQHSYILEHCLGWVQTKHKDYDYDTPEGVRVIIDQDEGTSYVTTAHKYARLIVEDPLKPIMIKFSTAKKAKLTKQNREEMRAKFWLDIKKAMETVKKGYDLAFVKGCATIPTMVAFPELDDEFDQTFIYGV